MVTTTTGIATEFIQFTRASNATVTDSDGKVKWAPHNLLTNSESFDAAAWQATSMNAFGSGSVANAVAAPNGTTTADLRVPANANSTHTIWQPAVTSVNGVSYTTVLFVKPNGYTKLALVENELTGYYVSYDATGSGTVLTESNATGTITPLSDGWYRITHVSVAGGTSYRPQIFFLPASYTTGTYTSSWTPNGTSGMYLWGIHLYRSDLAMQPNTSAYPMYNPTTPKNLLGYTESLTTGWTNSNTTDAIVSEVNPVGLTGAVDVAATAGNGTLLGSLSLLASPYTFSIWLKRKTGSGDVQLTVDGTTYATVAVTSTWTRFSTTLTPTAGTKTPGIRLVTSGDAVYAWGAQLSDSASLDTYSPVYGAAVTSAAYYGPRRDFDPVTLACKGLLVEEQRANLLTYSSDFNNWSKVNTTVTSDQASAPDGTITADTVAATTTGTYRYVIQAPTLTTGRTYTLSTYFKTKTTQWVWLLGETSSDAIAYFDIVNGVLGTVGAGLTASILPVGNGWFRCAITFTVTSATGVQQIGFGLSDSDATSSVTAGKDVYAWGGQLEENASFATSYIPTGAATATRNADVAQVSTAAFPYSATEGTIVVNVQHMSSPSSLNQAHWQIIGASNILSTDRFANSTSVAVRGLGLNADSSKTLTTNVAKVGTSFTTTEVNLLINGGSAYTNTSASGTLSGAVIFNIGNVTGTSSLNGWMRQVTYLPRKLSVSELQTRTS